MIEARRLTKFYGARRGVEGLTFHVEPGRVLGFLGPNGAGKTTTIKLLTGFFPPGDGSAQVGGFDILAESGKVREAVGYLPENAPAYGTMTVERFLRFMLELKRPEWRAAAARAEVGRTLEALELTDRRGQTIRSLSKGLRQRVGLAQALLGGPKVLILDEPTAGLDPAQAQVFRRLIARLKAEGTTVMLSTHLLGEVEALADRVAIVSQGLLVAFGTLAEVMGDGTLEAAFLRAVERQDSERQAAGVRDAA
jgi:ABC-2 type transport system ATP-binding protein